jgi:hypothetical protein
MPLGHGHAAAHAECLGRHLQSRCGLPPFLFVEIDQANDAADSFFILAGLDDFRQGDLHILESIQKEYSRFKVRHCSALKFLPVPAVAPPRGN